MHFLENFLELVRFLNYSEEDQIHMSQFLIRTDADALREEHCIAQVIGTPSHVYIKHGLTWATCLRHTVTKCHMWPVSRVTRHPLVTTATARGRLSDAAHPAPAPTQHV